MEKKIETLEIELELEKKSKVHYGGLQAENESLMQRIGREREIINQQEYIIEYLKQELINQNININEAHYGDHESLKQDKSLKQLSKAFNKVQKELYKQEK